MKMHWGWTKSLSLGLAVSACASSAWAGGPTGGMKPGAYARQAAPQAQERVAYDYEPQPGYPAGMPMGQPGMVPPGYGMPMMQPGMMPGGPGMMPGGPGMMPAGYMGGEGQDMVMAGPAPMGVDDCAGTGGSGCECNACTHGGHGGHGLLGGGIGSGHQYGADVFGGACGSCGGVPGGCNACGGPIRQWLACGPFGGRFLGRNGDCYGPGICAGLLGAIAPYSEGGICAQRWYDVSVSGIALRRSHGDSNIALSSNGIAGPIVLGTGSVDANQYEWGLLLTAACQLGPGSNLEVTYFGLNQWDSSATVTSNQPTLYSVYSNFGVAPPNGFDDSDRSFIHSITLNSAIHNGEVNYRRRWVGPNCWFQGSWLAGIRYFDLDETSVYSTRGQLNNAQNNGLRFLDTTTMTRNALTGFQVGGDLWANVIPGLHVGTEYKGGIFGNVAEAESTIISNSIANFSDNANDATTAYIGDIAASVVYRINYNWSFKASYHALFIDNVALASNNFNTLPPPQLVPNTARQAFINNRDNVTYEGYSLGLEYLW